MKCSTSRSTVLPEGGTESTHESTRNGHTHTRSRRSTSDRSTRSVRATPLRTECPEGGGMPTGMGYAPPPTTTILCSPIKDQGGTGGTGGTSALSIAPSPLGPFYRVERWWNSLRLAGQAKPKLRPCGPINPSRTRGRPVTRPGPVMRRATLAGADLESPGRMSRLPTEGPESPLPSSEGGSSRTYPRPLRHLHGYGHAPATPSPLPIVTGTDNPPACQSGGSVRSGGVVGVIGSGGGGKEKSRGWPDNAPPSVPRRNGKRTTRALGACTE